MISSVRVVLWAVPQMALLFRSVSQVEAALTYRWFRFCKRRNP